jgi:hypothetical protein
VKYSCQAEGANFGGLRTDLRGLSFALTVALGSSTGGLRFFRRTVPSKSSAIISDSALRLYERVIVGGSKKEGALADRNGWPEDTDALRPGTRWRIVASRSGECRTEGRAEEGGRRELDVSNSCVAQEGVWRDDMIWGEIEWTRCLGIGEWPSNEEGETDRGSG